MEGYKRWQLDLPKRSEFNSEQEWLDAVERHLNED